MSNSGANRISPLLINTMNHRLNIKSEPISPPRDSTTPSNHNTLRPPSQNQGHLSPGHVSPHLSQSHSNCSSPTAGLQHTNTHQQGSVPPPSSHPQSQQPQHPPPGMTEFDSPLMKRPRLEGWNT